MHKTLELFPGMPRFNFISMPAGFVFLTSKIEVREVDAVEQPSYALGIVNMYNVTLGVGGLQLGYYFETSALTSHSSNYLAAYRNKLKGMKLKDWLARNHEVTLKYRLDKLRIFTHGTDYVLITSDVQDKLKIKLERQEG